MTPRRAAGPAAEGQLPGWWLARPAAEPDPATRRRFDQVYAEALRAGPSKSVDYRLAAPKWQFLCHLGDSGLVALHGSGRDDIVEFEPRQSNDVAAFGAQRGVYASSDGIWPIFFAVVDRDRYQGTLVNAAVRAGEHAAPRYFFSLNADQLPDRPWRNGTVYLLPRQGFIAEEAPDGGGPLRVHSTQLVSLDAVVPLARLAVTPQDFPFLEQVRGHDESLLHKRSTANPQGFPWVDD